MIRPIMNFLQGFVVAKIHSLREFGIRKSYKSW